jgi:hypothetical protein
MSKYPQPSDGQVVYSSEDWARLQSTLDNVSGIFKEFAANLGWSFGGPHRRGVPARSISGRKGLKTSVVSLSHHPGPLCQETFQLWASVFLSFGVLGYLGLSYGDGLPIR